MYLNTCIPKETHDAGSWHEDFLADHAIEDPYDKQNLGS